MWWIVFTAIDLYIGVVVLQTMEPSVPPKKRKRLKAVQNILRVAIGLLGVALIAKLAYRPR